MANSPVFYTTPRIGAAVLDTGATGVEGTGDVALITAAATGTKVEEVRIVAGGDNAANPADSVVRILLTDGTSFWVLKTFDIGDAAAASTTAVHFEHTPWTPENLILPSGYSLTATVTVTPTAGDLTVFAHVLDA